MNEPGDSKKSGKNRDYSHLKWPAIIMGFLILLLIIFLNYCSRNGAY